MEQETEQQRKDRFLKDHPNGTWLDYEKWCGKEYQDFITAKLKEHATRNWKFLLEIEGFDNFMWLQEFIKTSPSCGSRSEMGDKAFEAYLRIGGTYNSLMAELSKDDLEREPIIYHNKRITELKQILAETWI